MFWTSSKGGCRRERPWELAKGGAVEQLQQWLAQARQILVFTGAGLSTGSGIADFRGPQGVWKRRQPVYFDDFLANEASRIEHWTYKLEGYESFCQARPNAAHRALYRLEQRGQLLVLVTQNIDGLHHQAGHQEDRVLELHGTNRLVECVGQGLGCGYRAPADWAYRFFERERRCPTCPECGGWVKTATVSFGQAMPAELMERALAAAEVCDLVLALGSTLSVYPAASVPLHAARRGVPYVVINQGPTDHDSLASLRLEADLCELLPRLLEPA